MRYMLGTDSLWDRVWQCCCWVRFFLSLGGVLLAAACAVGIPYAIVKGNIALVCFFLCCLPYLVLLVLCIDNFAFFTHPWSYTLWANSFYSLDETGVRIRNLSSKELIPWNGIMRVGIFSDFLIMSPKGRTLVPDPTNYILLFLSGHDELEAFPRERNDLFNMRDKIIAIRWTEPRIEELKKYWHGEVSDAAVRNSYRARFVKTRRLRELLLGERKERK